MAIAYVHPQKAVKPLVHGGIKDSTYIPIRTNSSRDFAELLPQYRLVSDFTSFQLAATSEARNAMSSTVGTERESGRSFDSADGLWDDSRGAHS